MNLRAEVLRRLEKMDVNPKRSLGQNFLIDEGVVEKIIRSVETTKSRQIVEIGPGVGSLTDSLINLGVPLILIELDRSFAGYWRERELRVVEGDALRIQWQDLDLISPTLLVSNLPYQISTSLVVDRCFAPIEITEMILMFQKEVAQRLTSSPRTKEYGMLSVIAQLFWQIRGSGGGWSKVFLSSPQSSESSSPFSASRRRFYSPGSPISSICEGGVFVPAQNYLEKSDQRVWKVWIEHGGSD